MAKKTTAKTPSKKPARQGRTAKPDPLAHIAAQLRPLAESLDAVVLNPKNAVTHGPESIAAIAASLSRFGQVKPIVANENDNVILAGNGTYQAAQSLGWTQIAVVWVQDDPASANGFAIADNRTAEFAQWDDQLLAELLAEVHQYDADLFAALDLADLCDVAGTGLLGGDEHVEFDAEKEVPETWIVAVEVDTKAKQKKLYEELLAEGYTVRLG